MVLVHGGVRQTDGRAFWRCGQDQRRQQKRLGLRRDGVVLGAAGRTAGLGLDDVDLTSRPVVHSRYSDAARVLTAVNVSSMSLRGAACLPVQMHAAHWVHARDRQQEEYDRDHGRRSMPGTGQG
jgi:hypothetical protein